jgi:hypothetical protein
MILTSCSTSPPRLATELRFRDERDADIVIRHYSEGVNRVLKPRLMEGPFLSTFDRAGVLELAKQRPGRELAVVILLQFNASDDVKHEWVSQLEGLGYKRVVFLRAECNLKINGLAVLGNPDPG